MVHWKRDSLVSVVLLCFYAVMFLESRELKTVARTYPQILILLCTVFTVALLIKSVAARRKEEASAKGAEERRIALIVIRDIGIICGAMIAYTYLINVLGYITSSVLFIAGILLYLRVKKWYMVAGVSLGTTLFLYYMFNHLLGILLPAGMLI